MRPTADPSELRRLAQRCRDQASHLDGAIAQLRSVVNTVQADWTGTASNSLDDVLSEQMRLTRNEADQLRRAAAEFERGAGEVQAYRQAEERREREERERRERNNRR